MHSLYKTDPYYKRAEIDVQLDQATFSKHHTKHTPYEQVPKCKIEKETRWCWIMMLASGCLLGLSLSLPLTMGVFFVEWYSVFNTRKELVALPLSLNSGMMLVFCELSIYHPICFPETLILYFDSVLGQRRRRCYNIESKKVLYIIFSVL